MRQPALGLASTWPLPRPYEELCPDGRRIHELRRALPETAEELAGYFFPEAFLQQRPDESTPYADTRAALGALSTRIEAAATRRSA